MTSVILPRPDYSVHVFEVVAQLRNDPDIAEAVKRGMKARAEGRVRPWSMVKKELGIR